MAYLNIVKSNGLYSAQLGDGPYLRLDGIDPQMRVTAREHAVRAQDCTYATIVQAISQLDSKFFKNGVVVANCGPEAINNDELSALCSLVQRLTRESKQNT